jgi:hypothetical protein
MDEVFPKSFDFRTYRSDQLPHKIVYRKLIGSGWKLSASEFSAVSNDPLPTFQLYPTSQAPPMRVILVTKSSKPIKRLIKQVRDATHLLRI